MAAQMRTYKRQAEALQPSSNHRPAESVDVQDLVGPGNTISPDLLDIGFTIKSAGV